MSTDDAPHPVPLHLTVAAGLCMGCADAVPGVSGGTIALILGVYERLVGSISTLLKLPRLVRAPEGRRELAAALRFLVPLGVGVVASLYVATRLLVGPEDAPGWIRRPETAPLCYAFFFGLVLASIREPWRHIPTRGLPHLAAAVLGAASAYLIIGLPYTGAKPETWMLLYGGALAISVMLLPGISGSLMLLVLGQYTIVTGAIHDRDFGTLGVFLVGILIGVALFVPLLRYLLGRQHDLTMATLTGLMAGSLRALWPWKSGYEPKVAQMVNVEPFGPYAGVVVAFVLGMLTVVFLAWLERRIEQA